MALVGRDGRDGDLVAQRRSGTVAARRKAEPVDHHGDGSREKHIAGAGGVKLFGLGVAHGGIANGGSIKVESRYGLRRREQRVVMRIFEFPAPAPELEGEIV